MKTGFAVSFLAVALCAAPGARAALLVWMLAFEVAASVWKVQVDYLLARDQGEYFLEGLRWLGWLPLAALFLWVREQLIQRSRRIARG